MRVRWTVEALKDLDDIESYIARDNPERAITFIEELIDFGDSLADFAYKGTQAKCTKDSSIKELYYKEYTFIYEIADEMVMIHEVHNFAKMTRYFN